MKWLAGALLAPLLLLGFLLSPAGAGANDPLSRAGLVVDYGDGALTYAIVPFDEETISGIELLHRSGVSLVTVDFGGLGEAVCTIGETGCGVGDCRQRVCQSGDAESPFWQYFRLNDDDQWISLNLGASATEVEHGTIDGWSWTGTEPELPVVDLDQIERMAMPDQGSTETPQAAARTYDAAGQLVTADEPSSSKLAYAGAAGVLLVLGATAGFLAIRRTRVSGDPT